MTITDVMKTLMNLPKDAAHKELYEFVFGKKLDLDDPKDLNEKIQWLLVNRYDENVSLFADKLAVRDYVRKCGYEDILTKLYGVFEKKEDLSAWLKGIENKKFILKCNHGSGPDYYSICKDIESFDIDREAEKLGKALKQDYSLVALEYQYHYIKPYIFAEELIGENVTDYKFFCFGGVPKYVKVIADRSDKSEDGKQIKHQDYYDMDWNFCPLVRDDISMNGGLRCPQGFDIMKDIAAKLSEPFPFARVDLYNENGKIYFGEITLSPAMGLNHTDKPETLKTLGDMVDLSYWKQEKLMFDRTDEIEKMLYSGGSEASGERINIDKKEQLGDVLRDSTEEKTGKSGLELGVTEKLRKTALKILDKPELLLSLSKEEINGICADCCFVMGSDADDELKALYMTILYYISFREDMSLEECWQIFWNINRLRFMNHNLKLIDITEKIRIVQTKTNNSLVPEEWLLSPSVDILYRYVFVFISQNIDYSGMEYRDTEKRNHNLVVLFTSQLLKVGHAPTQRVLDYSLCLQKNLGKKVVIINDAGMHYYTNKHLNGVVDFTFLEEFNASDHIDYKGERFEFLQISDLMPDISVLQQLVWMVYDLNPLFVYNIGGCSLAADLCKEFVTTASMPCSSSYPVTCSEYVVVAKPVSKNDIEYLNKLDYQKVVETVINYKYRSGEKQYTRKEFQIPEDAFLLMTVGYRIGLEMDEGFLRTVGRVLDINNDVVFDRCNTSENLNNQGRDTIRKNIYMAIVGPVDDKDRILRHFTEEEKKYIVFTGGLTDAGEFVKRADLYVNPDRSGGGRSAYEGLRAGVPIVSLRRGDAYYYSGEPFGVDDYEEYYEIVKRYYEDPEFYADRSERARDRSKILESMELTLKKLLEDINVYPFKPSP